MQVIIDNVPYAPVCNSSARIGIAISTHNRADVLSRALTQHMKFLPAGAPWEEMEAGKLYVGSEPKTYADAWVKQNHPERIYQEFIEQHRNDMMLNAGLLGGTRADVMAFAHGIIRLYYRIESYRFWKKEQADAAVGDMIAFGIVAKSFGDRIVTGPRIHTVFKSDGVGKEYAWWKHK